MKIDITNLNKHYRKNHVLNDLNLTLDNKQINFLVGANGTGKSTFLRCLLKLIKYQGQIDGHNVAIAYMPERLILPDYLRVVDFLRLVGQVRKMNLELVENKLEVYLEKFEMREHQDKSLIQLSKGMRQKVLLIQTLMSEADLFIFDEPLNGLDKKAQSTFMSEIANLRKQGKLIIITTHHITSYRFRNKRIVDFNVPLTFKEDDKVNQTPL